MGYFAGLAIDHFGQKAVAAAGVLLLFAGYMLLRATVQVVDGMSEGVVGFALLTIGTGAVSTLMSMLTYQQVGGWPSSVADQPPATPVLRHCSAPGPLLRQEPWQNHRPAPGRLLPLRCTMSVVCVRQPLAAIYHGSTCRGDAGAVWAPIYDAQFPQPQQVRQISPGDGGTENVGPAPSLHRTLVWRLLLDNRARRAHPRHRHGCLHGGFHQPLQAPAPGVASDGDPRTRSDCGCTD